MQNSHCIRTAAEMASTTSLPSTSARAHTTGGVAQFALQACTPRCGRFFCFSFRFFFISATHTLIRNHPTHRHTQMNHPRYTTRRPTISITYGGRWRHPLPLQCTLRELRKLPQILLPSDLPDVLHDRIVLPMGTKIHSPLPHHCDRHLCLYCILFHRRRWHGVGRAYAFPLLSRASHKPAKTLRVAAILQNRATLHRLKACIRRIKLDSIFGNSKQRRWGPHEIAEPQIRTTTRRSRVLRTSTCRACRVACCLVRPVVYVHGACVVDT